MDKVKEANRIWKHIKTNGVLEQGVANNDIMNFPSWINEKKFTDSQKHFQSLRVSFSISSIGGLMFLVHLPSGLAPLLKTGKSRSICGLFDRYLDTSLIVRKWFIENIFDKKSDSYKSLKRVNNMHRHIHTVMNATVKPLLNNNSSDENQVQDSSQCVWVSQYDMVITQWSFAGLMLLYPEKCGLHGPSEEDFESMIYMWRVLSYFMGIKSEYSLFTEDVQVTHNLCALIFEDVYRPVLSGRLPAAPQGRQMALDIIKSLRPVLGNISGEVLENYWYRFFGFEKLTVFSSWWDKLAEFFIPFTMNFLMKFKLFVRFFLWNSERQVLRVAKNRQSIIDSFPIEYHEEKFKFDLDL